MPPIMRYDLFSCVLNGHGVSDIRFLQFFFSSHLDHVELEMSYFEPVGTNIYGYSQLWVFKIWEHFCYVLEHFILFSKILGS